MGAQDNPEVKDSEERRRFLEKCGRFAVATPPAITLMLASAKGRPAWASGGGGKKGGGGKGGKK